MLEKTNTKEPSEPGLDSWQWTGVQMRPQLEPERVALLSGLSLLAAGQGLGLPQRLSTSPMPRLLMSAPDGGLYAGSLEAEGLRWAPFLPGRGREVARDRSLQDASELRRLALAAEPADRDLLRFLRESAGKVARSTQGGVPEGVALLPSLGSGLSQQLGAQLLSSFFSPGGSGDGMQMLTAPMGGGVAGLASSLAGQAFSQLSQMATGAINEALFGGVDDEASVEDHVVAHFGKQAVAKLQGEAEARLKEALLGQGPGAATQGLADRVAEFFGGVSSNATLQALRLGDQDAKGNPIAKGAANVTIEGCAAARETDAVGGKGVKVFLGAETVACEGLRAGRQGTSLSMDGPFLQGASTVLLGGPGGGDPPPEPPAGSKDSKGPAPKDSSADGGASGRAPEEGGGGEEPGESSSETPSGQEADLGEEAPPQGNPGEESTQNGGEDSLEARGGLEKRAVDVAVARALSLKPELESPGKVVGVFGAVSSLLEGDFARDALIAQGRGREAWRLSLGTAAKASVDGVTSLFGRVPGIRGILSDMALGDAAYFGGELLGHYSFDTINSWAHYAYEHGLSPRPPRWPKGGGGR